MPGASSSKTILATVAFTIALGLQIGAVIGAPAPPSASQPPIPSGAPAGGNQQQLSSKPQDQSQQHAGNPPVAPGPQPAGPGAGAQNGRAQQTGSSHTGTSNEWWALAVALVSAFAAFANAAAAGFLVLNGGRQLRSLDATVAIARDTLVETRKAVDAASKSVDALKNTERATLLVSGSGWGSDGEVDGRTGMGQGQVRCLVRNHGRTVGIVQSLVGTARYLRLDERPRMIDAVELSMPESVIPASGEIPTDFFAYTSKPDWSDRARASDRTNDMRMLIWGKITYADIFGNVWTTPFCLRFHPTWARFLPIDVKEIDGT